MRITTILTTLIFLGSCGTKKAEIKKPDERILFFDTRTVMEMDSLVESEDLYQKISLDRFNDKTDTITFGNDVIYISYLSIVNGCADYAGDIQFKGDSLILDLINKRDYVCTEERCDRVIFKIKNEGNREYKIKKW